MLRDRSSVAASTHSATDRALAPAALATGTPAAASASRSQESTPTDGICTNARPGAAATAAASIASAPV
jgi:hypothetical protein